MLGKILPKITELKNENCGLYEFKKIYMTFKTF